MCAIVGSFFAAFGLYFLVTQGIDLGIGNTFVDAFTAILSAHPLEAVVALGAFAVDPLDVTYTLAEWRQLRRVSASTERRMRRLGLGPRLVFLSQGRLGVTRKDDLAWAAAGGASGASAQSADPPAVTRNTGRDTRAATTASVASRKRKAAAPPPMAASPARPTVDSPAKVAFGTPPCGSPSPAEEATPVT
jgi:hypothetical protein